MVVGVVGVDLSAMVGETLSGSECRLALGLGCAYIVYGALDGCI